MGYLIKEKMIQEANILLKNESNLLRCYDYIFKVPAEETFDYTRDKVLSDLNIKDK